MRMRGSRPGRGRVARGRRAGRGGRGQRVARRGRPRDGTVLGVEREGGRGQPDGGHGRGHDRRVLAFGHVPDRPLGQVPDRPLGQVLDLRQPGRDPARCRSAPGRRGQVGGRSRAEDDRGHDGLEGHVHVAEFGVDAAAVGAPVQVPRDHRRVSLGQAAPHVRAELGRDRAAGVPLRRATIPGSPRARGPGTPAAAVPVPWSAGAAPGAVPGLGIAPGAAVAPVLRAMGVGDAPLLTVLI